MVLEVLEVLVRLVFLGVIPYLALLLLHGEEGEAHLMAGRHLQAPVVQVVVV